MLIKAIAIILLLSPFSATADSMSGKDKPPHAVVSGMLVSATYTLIKGEYVLIKSEYTAEIAFFTTMAIGVAKEEFGSNPYSQLDVKANLIGAGFVYGCLKIGEKYGFNLCYFEF